MLNPDIRKRLTVLKAIPRKGHPDPARRAVEHRRSFRRLVKWRTGCAGRITHLKRRFGWDRTRLDRLAGVESGVDTASSPTT